MEGDVLVTGPGRAEVMAADPPKRWSPRTPKRQAERFIIIACQYENGLRRLPAFMFRLSSIGKGEDRQSRYIHENTPRLLLNGTRLLSFGHAASSERGCTGSR